MRIVHFTHRFHPDIGGVELSVDRLAQQMAELGHHVTVVTESQASAERAIQGLRVVRMDVRSRWPVTRFFHWSWMWRHRDEFRCADVLHFHDYGTFLHWFFPFRFLWRHPVYAMTFHGFDSWPVKRTHDVLRRVSAKCMDVTFGAGEFIRKYYGQRLDNICIWAPLRRRTEGEWMPSPFFLYIGRLAPDTCIARIAMCLAEAAEAAHTISHLQLVGDGPDSDMIRAMQGRYFSVEIVEPTVEVDADLLRTGFVIGTGFLSILDAFAYGIPVVAPALTPIKRDYFESLSDISDLALYTRTDAELRDVFTGLLDGSGLPRAKKVAENAGRYVSTLTWPGVTELYIGNYAKRHP